jgi:hypothetical protein
MFQAEYSSGQPLRMLVDLRASVEQALGRGKPSTPEVKADANDKPAPTPAPKPATTSAAMAATAGASKAATKSAVAPVAAQPAHEPVPDDVPEFDISAAPGWDADSTSEPGSKK